MSKSMQKKRKPRHQIGKKIVFFLNIEPYSQDVVVVCNGEFKDAIPLFKRYNTPNAKLTLEHIEKNPKLYLEYEKSEGSLFTELPKGYVMVIKHCDSWIDTVGVVVHESTHLTHYILHRAGLTLSKDSEEAFTYLLEKTVERILHKIY